MNNNTPQNPGDSDSSLPSIQNNTWQLIRNTRLLLAGLLIVITIAIARQVIIPIEANKWFEAVLDLLVLVISDGLIIWLFTISFSINASSQDQEKHIRQLNRQKIIAEKTFSQQTENLKRHEDQNKVLIEIINRINEHPDPQSLCEYVVSLTQDKFHLYYSGLFLVDNQGKNALLRAGSGEAGKKMLANNFSLAINQTSMIGWSITNQKQRLSQDVETDSIHYKNPELPLTRSEVTFPLMSRGLVMGALTIQSSNLDAFDQDDIIAFQGIAGAVSCALDNSRLLEEIKKNSDEINSLNQKYLESAWNEKTKLNPNLSYTYENRFNLANKKTGQTYKIPMTLRGQTLGFLDLETEAEELSPEEMTLIETIINQTAISLENARLLEETQKQVSQEHYLTELTTRFSRAIDIDQILNIAVKELGQLPQVSEVSVYLKSPEADDLESSTISDGGPYVG